MRTVAGLACGYGSGSAAEKNVSRRRPDIANRETEDVIVGNDVAMSRALRQRIAGQTATT